VQRRELGEEPPEEDPMPNELEMNEFVPYDFFGLGQPVLQPNQNQNLNNHNQHNDYQLDGNGQQGQNDQAFFQNGGQHLQENEQMGEQQGLQRQHQQEPNLDEGLGQHLQFDQVHLGQIGGQVQQIFAVNEEMGNQQQQVWVEAVDLNGPNLGNPWELQQVNPWDPWPAWPQAQPAQQQAQQVLDLNLDPPAQQAMLFDLNNLADPMEVIINPVNPPNQEYPDLPEIEEVIEEHIPQGHQQNQHQNQMQIEEEDNLAVMGFPLPPLEDVLGEEIPLNQLMGQENEIQNDNEEGGNPQLEQQEGPGEEGFLIQHNDNMQLMQLANGDMQLDNAEFQGLHQDPQMQGNEVAVNNQHLQVGMVLMPTIQLAPEVKGKDCSTFNFWQNLINEGNAESFSALMPPNWIPFFTTLLNSAETFGWAKEFLTSGAATHLEDQCGNILLPVPKRCPLDITRSSVTITELDNTHADFTDGNEKNKPSKVGQERDLTSKTEEVKKRRNSKRTTPIVDSQVRRSDRIKLVNKGFKNSGCTDRRCTSCNPPTLSNNVIRNLGSQFCSMDQEDLSDSNLMRGENTMEPISRKKSRSNAKDKEEPKEEGSDPKKNGNEEQK